MQRIISGEGIHGLHKHSSSSDQNKKEALTRLVGNKGTRYEAMLSHSPSVAFDDTANLVENDGEAGME